MRTEPQQPRRSAFRFAVGAALRKAVAVSRARSRHAPRGTRAAMEPPPTLDRSEIFDARLAAEALNLLAPAIYRASVTGKRITVTAPDAETADAFRAVLDITVVDRPTDRLITVVEA